METSGGGTWGGMDSRPVLGLMALFGMHRYYTPTLTDIKMMDLQHRLLDVGRSEVTGGHLVLPLASCS